MPRIDFDSLPDHGRLWVFPADRTLTDEEARALLEVVDDFLDGWAAHGRPLRSGREMHERRFLLVGVDEDAEAPSGCSIDALVSRLRDATAPLGVTLVEHAAVWYREGGEIHTVSRPAFRALADRGEVGVDVRVFDPSLVRIGDLRRGMLERPARETWHGRAFFRERVGR